MKTSNSEIPLIFKNTSDRNLISSSLIFRNCFSNNDFKALSIAHIAEHCAIVQYIRRHMAEHACKHVIEYFSGRTNYDYTAFSINSLKKGYPYVLDIFNSILETRKVDEDIFNDEVKNIILEYPPDGLNSFNSKCKLFDSFINEYEYEFDAGKIIHEIDIFMVEQYLKNCYVCSNALITFLGDVNAYEFINSQGPVLDFSPVIALNNKEEKTQSNKIISAVRNGKRTFGTSSTFNNGKCEIWIGFKSSPSLSIKEFFIYDICFLLISSIFKNSYSSLLRNNCRYRSIELQNVGCSYQPNANYIAFRYVFGSEALLGDAAVMLKDTLREVGSCQESILKIKQEYSDSVLMKLDDLRYANQFFTRMYYLFNSFITDFKYYQEILDSIEAEDIWVNAVKILDCNYIFAFSRAITEDMLSIHFTASAFNYMSNLTAEIEK
jgi:predicted Zn-dependent peptidase